MAREPHHFTFGDFIRALFGSFIIGLTFMFKGSMIEYAAKMKTTNIILIIMLTCIIVTLEIYGLSYKYVHDKAERPFYEFWAKRFFAITISSFISLYIMIYLYGINNYLTQAEILNLASGLFLPAAVAGAAVEILKKW
ncbi:hypothetical protein COV19_01925 [Candidatus Woesearchaeota archaeon CG10_big_fil_rev_8_21_14_0_10_44_13]|nr:MAG: hypothetical protein COV19_01925 [Candidatus Woesearchaeota archaeon CG10_big_fil_rev_8_21_14_0_10_44_13]